MFLVPTSAALGHKLSLKHCSAFWSSYISTTTGVALKNDHMIWWWWWRGWRKSQPRVSLEQKASCTRNGAACLPCCAPPGMFQSKCTYAGGPIPPSFHCCTSSPSSNSNRCPISFQASASLQTGMSCLKTSCNQNLISTLQIISFCPFQTFTLMISPQNYKCAYCRNIIALCFFLPATIY